MSKKGQKTVSIAEFQLGAAPSQPEPEEQYYEEQQERPQRREYKPRQNPARNTDGWSRDAFGAGPASGRDTSPDRSDRFERGGFRRGGDGGDRGDRPRQTGGLRAGTGFNRNMFGSAAPVGEDNDEERPQRSYRSEGAFRGGDQRNERRQVSAFSRADFGTAAPTTTAPQESSSTTQTSSRSKVEVDDDGFQRVGGKPERSAAVPASQAVKTNDNSSRAIQNNTFFLEEDDDVDESDDHEESPESASQQQPEKDVTEEEVQPSNQDVAKQSVPQPEEAAPVKKLSSLSRFLGKGRATQPEPAKPSEGRSWRAAPPKEQSKTEALQQPESQEEQVPEPETKTASSREAPQVTQLVKDTGVAWGGAAAQTPAATLSFGAGATQQKPTTKQQPQAKKKVEETKKKTDAAAAAPRPSNSVLARAANGEQLVINTVMMKKHMKDVAPFPEDAPNARENIASSLAHSVINNEYSFDMLAFHWLKNYADTYAKAIKRQSPDADLDQLKEQGLDIAKDVLIATLQQLNKTNPDIIVDTFRGHQLDDLLKYAPSTIANEPQITVQKEKVVAFYKAAGLSKCLDPKDNDEDDLSALENASSLAVTLVTEIGSEQAGVHDVIAKHKSAITTSVTENSLQFFVDCFDVFNAHAATGAVVTEFMTQLLALGIITFQQADQWRSDAERTDTKRETLFKLNTWFRENEPKIQSYYDDEDEDDEQY